jgi:hypothetical protein
VKLIIGRSSAPFPSTERTADHVKLEKLFRESGGTADVSYAFIRQLLLMRPVRPLNKRPKIAGTKKALQRLSLAADRAAKVVEDLPANARAELYFRPAALQQLTTLLRVLAADAKADKTAKAGRPKKTVRPSQAEKVIKAVALYYFLRNNKKPTRRDPKFIKLLRGVYKVLGIKASAEYQADGLVWLPPEILGENS